MLVTEKQGKIQTAVGEVRQRGDAVGVRQRRRPITLPFFFFGLLYFKKTAQIYSYRIAKM